MDEPLFTADSLVPLSQQDFDEYKGKTIKDIEYLEYREGNYVSSTIVLSFTDGDSMTVGGLAWLLKD